MVRYWNVIDDSCLLLNEPITTGNLSFGHQVHSIAFFKIRKNRLSWNGDNFQPILTILVEIEAKMVKIIAILTLGPFDCIFRDSKKSPMLKITNFGTNFHQFGRKRIQNVENFVIQTPCWFDCIFSFLRMEKKKDSAMIKPANNGRKCQSIWRETGTMRASTHPQTPFPLLSF